jgi:transcription initiation factor IIE alpha subunit
MLADIEAKSDGYKCRKCGQPALSAEKAKNEGLDCPGCHKPLSPIPWMASNAGEDRMK